MTQTIHFAPLPVNTACIALRRIDRSMKTPAERLRALRSAAGYPTAAAAASAFGWVESTYRSHENGVRDLSRAAAARYAKAFRTTPGHILYGEKATAAPRAEIPLRGRIGAGQEVFPIDDGIETISPVLAVEGEAFEVTGDSMRPMAYPGDIVFIAPPKPVRDLIGRECLVSLADGRRFLKQLERGAKPNTYTLLSYNADPIRDVEVIEAGLFIGLIRRYKLY